MVTKAERKIPQRSCCGCREKKDKKELVRVLREPDGGIYLDPSGKRNGRGAYLCLNLGCLKAARKQKRLERALGTAIPDQVYAVLEEELSQVENG
ncbi:MAG: YlxR family protein [Oscillospiraceae bacterium]|nr:YlxR family protein [Oscillospiraceae bacterium]